MNRLINKYKLLAIAYWLIAPLVWAEDTVTPVDLTENTIVAFFNTDYKVVKDKSHSAYYRKLLAKKADGSLLVQDFYSSTDKKRTDVFLLLKAEDLASFNPASKQGLITEYYEQTGNKSFTCVYRQGKFNGHCYSWYDNGQLAYEFQAKEGFTFGVSRQWYKSGAKQEEVRIGADGKSQFITTWHENGRLASKTQYQGNKQYGLWQYWDDKGQLVKAINYNKDGIALSGKTLTFYTNGQNKQLTSYKKGDPKDILDGEWKRWYDNGQLAVEITYQENNPVGSYKFWYANGHLKEQGSFKNNFLEGVYQQGYENGQPRVKGQFTKGNMQGQWLAWYETGQQHSIIHYNKQGERDGLFRLWDNTGKLIKQAIYKDDLLVTDIASCALPLLEGKKATNLVCYFNRRGEEVKDKAASEYYHKVIKQNADKSLIVASFYTKGDKKRVAPIKIKIPYAISNLTLISMDGVYKSWYENGNKHRQSHYKDGELNGLSTEWEINGNLYLEQTFKKDRLDGVYRNYQDGLLKEEGSYKEGIKDGKWSYWSAGQKRSEEHYKNNRKEGLSQTWDEQGNLTWQGNFKDGYLEWEKRKFSLKDL